TAGWRRPLSTSSLVAGLRRGTAMSEAKRLSPKPARRYALYVRVSDAKQLAGVEYNSLASQEDMLRRWVAERPGGPGEVYRVYADVESGTKIKRDGLLELIADARAKKF